MKKGVRNAMAVDTVNAKTGETQDCPNCGNMIGAQAGSKEAICKNCGYKDPCCE